MNDKTAATAATAVKAGATGATAATGATGAAAIYARTSKEDPKSKKISIEQQVEDALDLAKKQGLTVDPRHIFIERDTSGKLPPPQWSGKERRKIRPVFGSLIAAIERGEVSMVFFRALDRMARNTLVSLQFLQLCEDCKVGIYTQQEKLCAGVDPSGRFALTVKISAAQYQVEQTATNIKAGKAYATRHGLKMAPVHTVGYRDGKKGEILTDDKGVAIVNELFDKYIAGATINGLVAYCNATYPDNHPNIGKRWHCSTVRRILENETYIGQGSQPYPPIVAPEKFLEAQKHRKARHNVKWGVKLQRHLLTGFLKCGYDGETMRAYTRYSKRGDSIPLGWEIKCAQKHSEKFPFMMREDKWLAFVERYIATAKFVSGNGGGDTLKLEMSLSRVESNVEQLKAAVGKGEMGADEFMAISKTAKQEAARLRAEIAKQRTPEPSQLKAWAAMTFEEKRARLSDTLDKIAVYRDGVVVYFKDHVDFGREGVGDFAGGWKVWFPLLKVKGAKGMLQNSLLADDDERIMKCFEQVAINGEMVWGYVAMVA